MGTIARGTKAGTGTTDFGTGTTILASEVNTDLNTVFNEVNGNLSSANLADNAVTTVKITDLNVTTAKLAANAVTTAKITDLNVTLGKLAVGAAVNDNKSATATSGLSFTTVETDLVTAASITTRGGRVLLYGTAAWAVTVLGGDALVRLRFYRGASVIETVDYNFDNTNTKSITVTHSMPMYSEAPAAGSYVYKVTLQGSGPGLVSITTDSGSPGNLRVTELA